MPTSVVTSIEPLENKIFLIRNHKVMIDRDIAALFGVSTKALNQAVRRNQNRFPSDFMFRLTKQEKEEVVTHCDHLKALKFSPVLPRAFTEHGVLMVANVLNSPKAIAASIWIIRVFIQMRAYLMDQKEIMIRLKELERMLGVHDEHIRVIFEAIRKLMAPPPEKKKRPIGFIVEGGENGTGPSEV